ncbi:hypothetical protein GCM10010228_55800 [Streptomyces massasporeus]|nr:hypothetical protein GCM10010228_55800 [Streptomyces massasporeus]
MVRGAEVGAGRRAVGGVVRVLRRAGGWVVRVLRRAGGWVVRVLRGRWVAGWCGCSARRVAGWCEVLRRAGGPVGADGAAPGVLRRREVAIGGCSAPGGFAGVGQPSRRETTQPAWDHPAGAGGSAGPDGARRSGMAPPVRDGSAGPDGPPVQDRSADAGHPGPFRTAQSPRFAPKFG